MFSVEKDDPFVIFRTLKEHARRFCRESDIVDLSRGDPGFCFTPSVRGRMFGGYVIALDSELNRSHDDAFIGYESQDTKRIHERIERWTRTTYAPQAAEELLTSLRDFMTFVRDAAHAEGKEWSDFDVLQGLFRSCAMSGGSYLLPQGEEFVRIIIAAWHRSELGLPFTSGDILCTQGASHAIGTIFKALGSEGCGYLCEGDTVFIASPVYAPYNRILQERGLRAISYGIDPITGAFSEEDKKNIASGKEKAKALILIDPNNPTGFSLPEEDVEFLATIAREQDLIIISDEVYFSFFPKKKTIIASCPERVLHINARSKIERSTGLRFGEILSTPEGRETIARRCGLPDGAALLRLLSNAKAPGRAGGQFQHTTFVPGPSQLLGVAHMVLGGPEREQYLTDLRENRTVFYEELSLPHKGNLYYVIFDLDSLPGVTTRHLSMEDRLLALAERGVIYLPVYQFFAESARKRPGILTAVRASIVNTTAERLRSAARITKEVLCG